MDLPIYLLDIQEDGDTEVNYVALVDRPAIKLGWQKFSEAVEIKFAADTDKQIITGPLMIADMPIYRKDEDGEYYTVFTADVIEKIAQKYFRKGYQSNVNLMHEGDMVVEGATMFESWIVNRELGKMPMKGYEDVADGSWFGSFKVDNEKVWQMVKDGTLQGFSVEGLFSYKRQAMSEQEILSQIQMLLSKISI